MRDEMKCGMFSPVLKAPHFGLLCFMQWLLLYCVAAVIILFA